MSGMRLLCEAVNSRGVVMFIEIGASKRRKAPEERNVIGRIGAGNISLLWSCENLNGTGLL
jgi:hypothetical protein